MIEGANWCRLQLAQMDMIICRDKSRNLTKLFDEVNVQNPKDFLSHEVAQSIAKGEALCILK